MSTVPLGTKYSAKIRRPPARWEEAVACSTPQTLSLMRSNNRVPGLCPKRTDKHELRTKMFIFFKVVSCDYLSKSCESKCS